MEELDESSARQYTNYLARAIRIVTDFPDGYTDLLIKQGIGAATKKIYQKLGKAFHEGEEIFFRVLSSLLTQAEDVTRDITRYLEARAIALWLDDHMSYDLTTKAEKFSIAPLVPYTEQSIITLNSLNDNEEESSICIMPHMPAVRCFIQDNKAKKEKGKEIEKDLHMKTKLTGINNDLKNCRYRVNETNIVVEHVILSWETRNNLHSDFFRVAFAPLTKKADLLQPTDEVVPGPLGNKCRKSFEEPKSPEYLETRLKEVIMLSAQSGKNFDLLFAPEMLGTKKMYETDFLGTNTFVDEIINECKDYADCMPKIIVLPSRTIEKTNHCQIVNGDGTMLGDQYKMHPVYISSESCDEYLENEGKIRLLILHIPGYERIAILICKDFIAEEDQALKELLYKQINPTLIIVPSYTLGETDFVEELPSVKKYGTSVVWGTCCGGPIASEPYIGAASIIRMDPIPKMSDVCRCERKCEDSKVCIFYIDLPLNIKEREPLNIQFNHLYIST